jgi:hypothetical protein
VELGQSLVVAAATDGAMRPDFPFFPAFEQRGERCADDVRLLPALARSDREGVRYARVRAPEPRRHVSALVRRGAATRPSLAAGLSALAAAALAT